MYNGLITAILNKLTFKHSLVFISIIKNINGYQPYQQKPFGSSKSFKNRKGPGTKKFKNYCIRNYILALEKLGVILHYT